MGFINLKLDEFMNFEINFFFVIFVLLMIYLAVIAPVSGYLEHNKLKRLESHGTNKKLKGYQSTIIWSWLPVVLILLLLLFSDITLSNIGFRWININTSALNKWIVIPFIALCLIYLFYNVYSIIILKINKKARLEASKNLPEYAKTLLPITRLEKKTWVFVALTAGITEEIVYRGYLFFAFALIFPSLSIFHVLIISTFIFGIGHIYQGKEVVKSTILGLVFGFSYIIFDSIIPIIVLHSVQDLVVTNLIDEE